MGLKLLVPSQTHICSISNPYILGNKSLEHMSEFLIHNTKDYIIVTSVSDTYHKSIVFAIQSTWSE